MAIEKTININVDSKRAVKSLEELGGTFEDVYGEVQPLNTQIGELEDRLYEMSLRGEQGTAEFKHLTSQVGKMRKTIIDTDMAIDGMSQNLAQAGTGAVMGLASGFELAQGSMAAFGVEGQAIEETLLRVQSAMAISQGLQGIREAIPSFRNLAGQVKNFGGSIMSSVKSLGAFQKAMIATGIGAIIAGIGLLIANWDKLTAAIGGVSKEQQMLNDIQSEAVEGAAEELSVLGELQRTINDENVSRKEKNEAVKALQKEYPDLLTNVDAEKSTTEELNLAIERNSELVLIQAEMKAIAAAMEEEMTKKVQANLDAQNGQNKSWYDGIIALNANTLAKDVNASAQAVANQRTQEANDLADENIKILDERKNELKDLQGALEEKLGIEKESNEVNKDAIKIARERFAEEWRLDAERKARWAQEDADLEARIEAAKQRQIELDQFMNESADAAIEAEVEREQKASDALFARLEKERQAKEQARQQDEEREEQVNEAKYNIAESSLSAINNLVQSFAGENEKAQKRAFQVQKAINIAQAVMDTYKSANAIFASTAANPITTVNPAAPFIAAGAAVAAGLANVASIARQEFQGGSSGGGGGGANAPTLNAGGGGGSNPATFNVVGNTGTNQLAESLGSQPMKAYVVGGDVSTAQELERNKIQQSSL